MNDPCQEYYLTNVLPRIEEYRSLEEKKKMEFFGWQMTILIVGVGITIINATPIVANSWIRVVSTVLGRAVAVMEGYDT